MDISKNCYTTDVDTRLVLVTGSGSGDNTSRRNENLCVPSTSTPVIEDSGIIWSDIPCTSTAVIGDSRMIRSEFPSTSAVINEQTCQEMRQTEKKQCSIRKNFSLSTLEEHFSQSLKDAAKSLGVCPNTLKRVCREHDIPRWPSRQVKKVKRSLDKIQDLVHSRVGFEAGVNLHSIMGNDVADIPNSIIPSGACLEGSGQRIIVKATYNDNTVRFKFDPSAGYSQLFEEVGKRFSLQTKTFELKYVDHENQLLVLRSDSDLHECLEVFASVGSSSIKVEGTRCNILGSGMYVQLFSDLNLWCVRFQSLFSIDCILLPGS